MGRVRPKRVHHGNGNGNARKTKRRTRDLDQIYDEIQPDKVQKTHKDMTTWNEDKPGLGQFYCIPCARYFINSQTIEDHTKTKPHKKRLKSLKDKPWTPEDALGKEIDNGKKKAVEDNVQKLTNMLVQ